MKLGIEVIQQTKLGNSRKTARVNGSQAVKTLISEFWYKDYGEMEQKALIGGIPTIPMISSRLLSLMCKTFTS